MEEEKEVLEELDNNEVKEDTESTEEETEESSDSNASKDDLEDLALDKEVPLDADGLEQSLETGGSEADSESLPMESVVEIETLYDYRTLKYINMYVVRVKRKSRITSLVLTIAAFLAGGYIGIWAQKYFYFGIILGVLGLWMLFNVITEENRIDKQLKKYFASHQPLKQKFLINEEKIRVIATVGEKEQTADYPWAYVQSIDVIPEYIFLFVNSGSPLVLDTKEVAYLKGSKDELNAILKEEASLKPYKYYDKKFFKNHNFEASYPVTLDEEKDNKEKEE